MALDLPTARVRRCVPPAPGMVPRLISGWPNLALSAARMRSHIMASSQPPPERIAGHGGDHRLAVLGDVLPGGDEVAGAGAGEVRRQHLLDVGPGGERLLRAGDHHRTHGVVVVELAEGRVELGDQLVVERVQRLGPVERDQADSARGARPGSSRKPWTPPLLAASTRRGGRRLNTERAPTRPGARSPPVSAGRRRKRRSPGHPGRCARTGPPQTGQGSPARS